MTFVTEWLFIVGALLLFASVGGFAIFPVSAAAAILDPVFRSDSISDSVTGFGDLLPFFLRWNAGVNNFMTYVTGGHPSRRLPVDPSGECRHRARHGGWQRRVHLFR